MFEDTRKSLQKIQRNKLNEIACIDVNEEIDQEQIDFNLVVASYRDVLNRDLSGFLPFQLGFYISALEMAQYEYEMALKVYREHLQCELDAMPKTAFSKVTNIVLTPFIKRAIP